MVELSAHLGIGFRWLAVSVCFLRTASAIEVTAVPSASGATITAAGEPFAEYLTRSGFQPVIWPIIGPTGQELTRSYPLGPLHPGEVNDHPHHRSLWFSHGNVNGLDFWSEFENATAQQVEQRPLIAHQRFLKIGQEGLHGVVITENAWVHQGTTVCEDQRTIYFGAEEDVRWIDFSITLKATGEAVTFRDTKEGTFGIRVPGTMKVDAKLGGKIVNSQGQRNEAAWGQPARWVTYYGPVEGEIMGITILNHPSSYAYPTRWHVRTYGLFAANPFGEHEFPSLDRSQESMQQGAKTLQHGEALTLRYLVILHKGEITESTIKHCLR